MEEGTEDGRKVSGCDAGAVVDQSPHKLSNIIVLVFSELASFVRTILQEEQNEGVELTEHPCNGSKEPHMQWREKRHESLRKEHVQDSSGSRSERISLALGKCAAISRHHRVLGQSTVALKSRNSTSQSTGRPKAAWIAHLGEIQRATGALTDAWSLEPLYLRKSAAEEKWDRRER